MAALAFAIGQPADSQQVRAVEEPPAVLEVQTLAGVEFLSDVDKARRSEAGRRQRIGLLGDWVIG